MHCHRFADLDVTTLYSLLRLRVDVFVVEQHCAYPELDGRDTEPSTWHLWTSDDGGPTAYLHLLTNPGDPSEPGDVFRIGRVCTRADARGIGLAGDLMVAALELAGERQIVLDAQSHLAGWYARYGFRPTGAEFVEDGIPHIPMRRDRVTSARPRQRLSDVLGQ